MKNARSGVLERQRFGAHMSTAGGLENALYAGREVGCDTIQLFVKNQRQWKAPPLREEQVRAFKRALRETGIRPVIAHASYLLNLASPDKAAREKSCAALVDELTRCEALGITGLVIHPGAHMGDGEDVGIRRIIRSLDGVHRMTRGYRAAVLLETTAGQGSAIGHRVEHLGSILGNVKEPERLAVCLDTCHLFAAGYDLRKEEGYEQVVLELKRHVELRRVKCIHTNDSKTRCGSRVDRHENINRGKIGRIGFSRLVNDRRLAAAPKILETPKGEDGRGRDMDVVNLAKLRKLIR